MTRRGRILLLTVAVLIAVALIPIIHHYQLKVAVSEYWAGLKARGEPVDLAQVLPPRVPSEHDSAELFANAVSLFADKGNALSTNQPPTMRIILPGRAMAGWLQPEVRNDDATNSWEEIEAALAEDKAALDLLHKLPDKAEFDFKLNYSDGFTKMKFGPLAQAKRAAQLLSASTVVHLRHNDAAVSTKDIGAMLSIVNGLAHDRTLISELVRIAISQIAVGPTWELLQFPNINEQQLAALQRNWAGLEFSKAFENAMLVERACGKLDLDELRKSNLNSYFVPLGELGLSTLTAAMSRNSKSNTTPRCGAIGGLIRMNCATLKDCRRFWTPRVSFKPILHSLP